RGGVGIRACCRAPLDGTGEGARPHVACAICPVPCPASRFIIETLCLPVLSPPSRPPQVRYLPCISFSLLGACSLAHIPPTNFDADNCRWRKLSSRQSRNAAT